MKTHSSMIEWQTKNICSMFGVMAETPKAVKAIENAVKKMHLPLTDEVEEKDNRAFSDVVEEGAKVDVSKQPTVAQFHKMLGGK